MKEDDSSTNATPRRHARLLQVLATLGTASALWAIFLWRELIQARAGETPFCGFGESADCGTLWNAAFANTIHQTTGLPVAGWGLAWGLVAAMLPLLALAFRGREQRAAAACSAIDLTAAAGVAGLVVLLAASAAEGLFCTSCALTYVLTLAYAAVTYFGLRERPLPRSPQGVTLAAATTLAVYLLLLYPGLKTPKNASKEGQRALADAGRRAAEQAGGTAPEAAAGKSEGGPRLIGGVNVDRMLQEFVGTLRPQTRQGLSDTLHLYRGGASFDPEPPRVLALGTTGAGVLITEFTDVLCSHCATLHQTLDQLADLLPHGSFHTDARHFPLDGRCNAHLKPRDGDDVRCVAARAQICMEDAGGAHDFAGALFARQGDLTADLVLELAAPFLDRGALELCLSSEATARKLAEDVDYAARYDPHGTPVVLIDGRLGYAYAPFLYAIILTQGDPDHPAFGSLPPPNEQAHVH